MNKNTDRWMFYLPNDESGRSFLESLKSVMNTDRYTLRARGRRPDREKAVELGYCDHYRYRMFEYSVPVEVAKLLAVYIEDKVDDKDRERLWRENYDLRQKADRADVREARITELEKQVASLEEDLQLANIEASYDDLQQEYRYNPANDTIKVNALKHSHTVGEALELTDALDKERAEVKRLRSTIAHYNGVTAEIQQLRTQVENQRATIKVYQVKDKIYHDNVNELSRLRHDYQKKDEHVTKLINDKIELECKLNDLKNNGISKCCCDVVQIQERRIEELEAFIQRLESETSGLSCLLQNDMRDLDIPIDD